MLPQYEDDLTVDFKIEKQPSLTYRMDLEKNKISGSADGLEAMKQAVYKILSTERYQYAIYSWNYGVELTGLIGKPIPYVYSEIKDKITEALMQDDRILSVSDFSFEKKRGIVAVRFKVKTTSGELEMEKEVSV